MTKLSGDNIFRAKIYRLEVALRQKERTIAELQRKLEAAIIDQRAERAMTHDMARRFGVELVFPLEMGSA